LLLYGNAGIYNIKTNTEYLELDYQHRSPGQQLCHRWPIERDGQTHVDRSMREQHFSRATPHRVICPLTDRSSLVLQQGIPSIVTGPIMAIISDLYGRRWV